jgi:glycerol transport system ATP-binding protein
MQLTLEGINKRVGAQTWLRNMHIAPRSGAVTVLLGATQAGKTSLMRIMAGLDVPTSSRVMVDGKNVVGVPVRERNVAMVYQQFINYPSMKVRDNIASPLKLRGEKNVVQLTALFAAGDSTVVYATTEPGEALLLGGYTAVLDEGELLQYGPTAEVFHKPASLRVARAFSDPPMNLLPATATADGMRLDGGPLLTQRLSSQATPKLTVGLRANAVRVRAQEGDVALAGKVELAEISGSDTFVHAHTAVGDLVAQLTGVHYFEIGTAITLFDALGKLVLSPVRGGGR